MPSPGLPGGECQTQSETCQLDESVIAIKQSVQTIGQCRQYCREKDGCTHFTLFGREEFELVNTCVLFSSCFSTNPCTDCISEDTTRPCHLCSSPVVEGKIGANNLLEFLPKVEEMAIHMAFLGWLLLPLTSFRLFESLHDIQLYPQGAK